MTRLIVETFGGMRPKGDPASIGYNESSHCSGHLWSGKLRPYRGASSSILTFTKAASGNVRSFYRWNASPTDPAAGSWFNWITDVDVARGPIPGDTEERTYFTGDGAPKMTYSGIATGADLPNASYLLGVPAPTGSPTATISGSAGDAEDAVSRRYAITYVTAIGEEGPPLFFGSVTWYPTNTVNLASLPTGPGGNYNLSTKRIYRTATGANGTAYYFVASISLATTSYNDAIADTALGEEIESTNYAPPPSDMHSIGVLPNGIMFGASKNQVCFSEAYLPHAWNPLNRYNTNHPIIACKSFGNTVVAITHRSPHLITGINPDGFDGTEMDIQHGGVAKRSACSGPLGVGYASDRGYILINESGWRNITEDHYDKHQWAALEPEKFIAVQHDGRIWLFGDYELSANAHLVLDPSDPQAFLTSPGGPDNITAAFADPLTNRLYVAIADALRFIDDPSANTLPCEYIGKLTYFPQPVSFQWCKVSMQPGVAVAGQINVYLTNPNDIIGFVSSITPNTPTPIGRGVWGNAFAPNLIYAGGDGPGTIVFRRLDWATSRSELEGD